jgi:hypothetical protein
MRRILGAGRIALSLSVIIGSTSCTMEDSPSLSESSSLAAIVCPVTFNYHSSKFVTVNDHTSYEATWFVVNSSGSDVAVTSESCVKTGNVTTCSAPHFASFLPANSKTDAQVVYTTGNPGSGTVALRIGAAGCGTLTAPPYQLTIN